jgi:hypothetical protein
MCKFVSAVFKIDFELIDYGQNCVEGKVIFFKNGRVIYI